MHYGKRITTESFHNGTLASKKEELSIPVLVHDKTQALTELMKALELITSRQSFKVCIEIDADPNTHKLRKITTQYVVQ